MLCSVFCHFQWLLTAASTVSTNSTQNVVGTNNTVSDYGLSIGDSGDKVVELQKWLKNQGYYVGAIDGNFGPYTKLAVEYFQTDSNIVVDGWVADQTVGAMNDLTGTTTFTLSQSGNDSTTDTTSKATTSKATTCKATTSKVTANATTSKATTSKVTATTTTSKATTSKVTATTTTSKATTSKATTTSSSTLSEILASGAKYGYSHSASTAAAMESIGSGDCWAMSDYLYGKLSAAGISCRIVQYSTAYSSNHRSVQLYQNGAWVDVPYSSYGYNMLFHATSSKPGMTVLASC